jgi:hypothetical protein
MNTRIKGIGPGHYSVQANDRPKARYEEIGQVWKEGSKWRATGYDDTLKSKRIAVAWVVGQFKVTRACASTEAADDYLHEHNHVHDCVEEEKWPENAKWPEGTMLRHSEGYKGALHSCFVATSGKLRYGIRIMAGKAGVYGYENKFEEVTA